MDCCINAWTVANGVWLGADITDIVDWFLEHRLPDGGWNCEWVEGSTRSSFHSTLNPQGTALPTTPPPAARRHTGGEARRRGIPTAARLFRRLSTAETCGPVGGPIRLPLPLDYNVLNAAEYFREASLLDGVAPDPRMTDAIELIRAAKQPDGTWLQAGRHLGRVWFEVDAPAGEPSKWLTLFGTRVLAWWEAGPDWSDSGHHR